MKDMKLDCRIQKDSNIVRIVSLPIAKPPSGIVKKKSRGTAVTGRWTTKEKLDFIYSKYLSYIALMKYGKNWAELKKNIPTRTIVQIRTHSQKFFMKVRELAPKDSDLLVFLKTKPPEFFLSFGKENNAEIANYESPYESICNDKGNNCPQINLEDNKLSSSMQECIFPQVESEPKIGAMYVIDYWNSDDIHSDKDFRLINADEDNSLLFNNERNTYKHIDNSVQHETANSLARIEMDINHIWNDIESELESKFVPINDINVHWMYLHDITMKIARIINNLKCYFMRIPFKPMYSIGETFPKFCSFSYDVQVEANN